MDKPEQYLTDDCDSTVQEYIKNLQIIGDGLLEILEDISIEYDILEDAENRVYKLLNKLSRGCENVT